MSKTWRNTTAHPELRTDPPDALFPIIWLRNEQIATTQVSCIYIYNNNNSSNNNNNCMCIYTYIYTVIKLVRQHVKQHHIGDGLGIQYDIPGISWKNVTLVKTWGIRWQFSWGKIGSTWINQDHCFSEPEEEPTRASGISAKYTATVHKNTHCKPRIWCNSYPTVLLYPISKQTQFMLKNKNSQLAAVCIE